MSRKILIIGAGAVGQVYGWGLQRAGAEVNFYVRPRYAEAVRAGLPMWRRRIGRRPERSVLRPTRVFDDLTEARKHRWDEIWLAISSTASSDSFIEQVRDVSPEATIVVFPTHPDGLVRLRARLGERLVAGLISFIAWQAPLPGERDLPGGTPLDSEATTGVAFWIPPTSAPFSGSPDRLVPVVEHLRRGGLPATAHSDLARTIAWGGALLQLHIAALDAADWSFSALRQNDLLPLTASAWRELVPIATAVVARAGGQPSASGEAPFWAGLIRPGLQRLVLWLAPRILPFDLPTYLGYHFTKVGDQTRANLDAWIHQGQSLHLPVDALMTLRGRMRPTAFFAGSPIPR